jgi:hypothetical protein
VYSWCWWESLKERDIFQGLGVNRRIILISIFEIGWGGRCDLSHNREKMAGSSERGDEPSGSKKCGEFLDQMRTLVSCQEVSSPRIWPMHDPCWLKLITTSLQIKCPRRETLKK